jgi:hypothetical protein
MYAATTDDFDFRFNLTRNAFIVMLAASAQWITLNDEPIVPVGLIFVVGYIARNFAFTYGRALIEGWKPLLACLGAAFVGRYVAVISFGAVIEGGGARLVIGSRLPALF